MSGTKYATVKIISAEKDVIIPVGKVLLEVSRAKDVIGSYITFDKCMHKGSGSAQIICSKFKKVDPPQSEEKQLELKEEPAPEPQPKPVTISKFKPVSMPEPKPEPLVEPEPDVEKLQQQIVSLKGSLENARAENDKLKGQLKKLESEFKNLNEADKLVLGGEEFFPGEKKDTVLAAIIDAIKGLEEKTRRSDVLKGILESNEYEQLLEKKREAVEKILKDYNGISGTMEKQLADLGLMLSDVGRHYKIRYYNNPRYWITMAKTPSDSVKGDKNLISKIKKKML